MRLIFYSLFLFECSLISQNDISNITYLGKSVILSALCTKVMDLIENDTGIESLQKVLYPHWGVMLQLILVCIPKRNLDVSSQHLMPVGRPWLMDASEWCRWIVVDDCCNWHSTVWSWHSQFPSQWSQMTTHSLLTSCKDNIMHVFSLSQKGPLNVQSSAIITPSNIVGYHIITGTESEYQSDP